MDILERARKIARRYMDENPPVPLKMRAFYDGGVRRGSDYRYHADMDRLFPQAKMGDRAFVRCLYTADGEEEIGLTVTLFGPAVLRVNGAEVFRSNIFTERNNHTDNRVDIHMNPGENLLELELTKTPLGFGCIFGTWLGKWDYIFMRPDEPEAEGCQYRLNGGPWLPKSEPVNVELKPGEYALFAASDGNGPVTVRKTEAAFPPDENYSNLFGIEGHGAWLGLWPLKEEHGGDLFARPAEGTYWRFKEKNLWLRPCYGAGNFGRWSYPLGVTLYGLLRLGQLLDDREIKAYVAAHVERCLNTFDYALWDRDSHGGAASLHNLLCGIDSLDDCGAFGALVEEAALTLGVKNTEKICAYISDYIENRQPRRDSGAFYRKNQLHSFHNDTMWLDDLYMSVPFLCRRYKITGEERFLTDAANQFRQYKKLLYMEDKGLMSHVYDFRHGLRNGVAWGRGNGWTLFSLSELLTFMPEDFPDRPEMEAMFKELCAGYAARQSEDGRWRQVLDDPEAYLETSCTAMFACAFTRGVKMGLLEPEYAEKARRAVNSIVENCTDGEGSVYGVCRGSEFAFRPDYYKYELTTRVNDTHGIGIVLLAVYEVTYGA